MAVTRICQAPVYVVPYVADQPFGVLNVAKELNKVKVARGPSE
jgi:hypothetical protein